jgi:hypothetical protein
MRLIKYFLLLFAVGLAVINVEPTLFSNVHFPFEGLLAMAGIPVIGLYSDSDVGLGKIASHHPNTFIETKSAEGEVLFGRALEYGTTRQQIRHSDGVSGGFAGVSMYSVTASKLSESKYTDADVAGVCRSGFITANAEEAVNSGDSVRVRHTNHASDPLKLKGNFSKTADAGKTYLLAGATFEKTTTGAGETVIFLTGNFTITPDV